MKRLIIMCLLVVSIISTSLTPAIAEVDCKTLMQLGKEAGVLLVFIQVGNKLGIKVNSHVWMYELTSVEKIGTLHCAMQVYGVDLVLVYSESGKKMGLYSGGANYIGR